MKANSRLKPVLTGLVAAAILFGLTTGSVVAHEGDYDNSRPPHESPHKAEPPTGGHPNLASAATNPIANLIQFQLQDQYNWDNNNSSGYSNALLIQPVVPVKMRWDKVPLLITRTTIPYVSTPDFGTPTHRKHGLGDTTLLAIAIPNFGLKGQTIGLGVSNVFPTGGDNDFTGNGKWLTGPAFVYLNQMIPKLQIGFLGWHNFTIGETSSGDDKKNVTKTSVQPILTKHFGKGWYVAMQDVTWNYNHKTSNWTLPTGPRVGKVFKIGAQPINLFGAVYYDPKTDGANAKWSAKINLTLLYPE